MHRLLQQCFWCLLSVLLCAIPTSYGRAPGQSSAESPTGELIPVRIQWVTQKQAQPVNIAYIHIVRVEDALGEPIPNVRVDWILNTHPKAVGTVLESDDADGMAANSRVASSGPHAQRSNRFAVTYTNPLPETIVHGSENTVVGPGETWIRVGAARPGVTYVTAFCPAIPSQADRISTRRLRWERASHGEVEAPETVQPTTQHNEPVNSDPTQDMIGWHFPENAQSVLDLNEENRNTVPVVVRIYRCTDQEPVAGVSVRYSLLGGGPSATLGEYTPEGLVAAMETMVVSDTAGIAGTQLTLHELSGGMNQVHIEILDAGLRPDAEHIYQHTWVEGNLRLRQQGPPVLSLKSQARYTISVENSGAVTASELRIEQRIPAPALAFVSASDRGEWNEADGKITWHVGRLEPAQRVVRSFQLQAVDTGVWTTTLRSTSKEGLIAEKDTTIQVVPVQLDISVNGPTTAQVGQNIDYIVTVKNLSELRATTVHLTLTLPTEGLAFSSIPRGVVHDGDQLIWRTAELVSGAMLQKQVRVRGKQSGAWSVKAEARWDQGSSASAQVRTKILATTLRLIAQPFTVSVGKESLISIVLKNDGQSPITDLIITLKATTPLGSLKPGDGGRITSIGQAQWNLSAVAAQSEQRFSATIQAQRPGKLPVNVTATSNGSTLATAQTMIVIPGN